MTMSVAFSNVIQQGTLQQIQDYLRQNPQELNEPDSLGKTAIMLAVCAKRPAEIIQYLLSCDGISLNAKDKQDKNIITHAMEQNQLDIALQLLLCSDIKLGEADVSASQDKKQNIAVAEQKNSPMPHEVEMANLYTLLKHTKEYIKAVDYLEKLYYSKTITPKQKENVVNALRYIAEMDVRLDQANGEEKSDVNEKIVEAKYLANIQFIKFIETDAYPKTFPYRVINEKIMNVLKHSGAANKIYYSQFTPAQRQQYSSSTCFHRGLAMFYAQNEANDVIDNSLDALIASINPETTVNLLKQAMDQGFEAGWKYILYMAAQACEIHFQHLYQQLPQSQSTSKRGEYLIDLKENWKKYADLYQCYEKLYAWNNDPINYHITFKKLSLVESKYTDLPMSYYRTLVFICLKLKQDAYTEEAIKILIKMDAIAKKRKEEIHYPFVKTFLQRLHVHYRNHATLAKVIENALTNLVENNLEQLGQNTIATLTELIACYDKHQAQNDHEKLKKTLAQRAALYLEKKDYLSAIQDYKRLTEIDSHYAFEAAKLLVETENYEEAFKYLQRAILTIENDETVTDIRVGFNKVKEYLLEVASVFVDKDPKKDQINDLLNQIQRVIGWKDQELRSLEYKKFIQSKNAEYTQLCKSEPKKSCQVRLYLARQNHLQSLYDLAKLYAENENIFGISKPLKRRALCLYAKVYAICNSPNASERLFVQDDLVEQMKADALNFIQLVLNKNPKYFDLASWCDQFGKFLTRNNIDVITLVLEKQKTLDDFLIYFLQHNILKVTDREKLIETVMNVAQRIYNVIPSGLVKFDLVIPEQTNSVVAPNSLAVPGKIYYGENVHLPSAPALPNVVQDEEKANLSAPISFVEASENQSLVKVGMFKQVSLAAPKPKRISVKLEEEEVEGVADKPPVAAVAKANPVRSEKQLVMS